MGYVYIYMIVYMFTNEGHLIHYSSSHIPDCRVYKVLSLAFTTGIPPSLIYYTTPLAIYLHLTYEHEQNVLFLPYATQDIEHLKMKVRYSLSLHNNIQKQHIFNIYRYLYK